MPFCLLAYGSAIIIFSSSQYWFFMWLMMELSTLGFIGLCFYEKSNSENITLYFLIQSVASFFILMATMLTSADSTAMFYPNFIMFASILMKLGMFPFNSWVPAVTMPMKKLLIYIILVAQKIIPFMWLLANSVSAVVMLMTLSIMNLLWVSPQNLFQTSLKMIIVVSSISHSSWVLLALSSKFLWEIYFSVYAIMLYCVISLINEKLKNIFQKNDRTPLFLIFLTLGGVPPFMGFYPKFFLIFEILQMNFTFFFSLFMLMSLVDLSVYMRLSMPSILKKKSNYKWSKSNEITKLFVLTNIMMLGLLAL